MKLVVQRVQEAQVSVGKKIVGKIDKGFLVLLGVTHLDTKETADFLTNKLCNLRVFEDQDEKMNLSIKDVKGQLLIVSQFTLCADCKKGTRPSFDNASEPQKAVELYEYFVKYLKEHNMKVQTGKFRAMMDVELINDGPVTFWLEK